jgi:hypothetical protein
MMVAVHTNGPLTILPHLFREQKWGYHRFPKISGTCLVLQVIYAVEMQTGISADKLTTRVNNSQVYAGGSGLTLLQISSILEPALKGKRIGALRHKTVTQALDAMKQGRTVVAVVSAYDDVMLDCAGYNGIIPSAYVLNAKGPVRQFSALHSLMIAGVDEQENTMIVRESRPCYGWQQRDFVKRSSVGKIPIDPLIKNRKAMAYIEVVVH